ERIFAVRAAGSGTKIGSALFLRTLQPVFAASGARWKGMTFRLPDHPMEGSDHVVPSRYVHRRSGLDWNADRCTCRRIGDAEIEMVPPGAVCRFLCRERKGLL